VPNGKGIIRFLAAEGAEVKTGDKVAEIDSTAFVQQIKDRTSSCRRRRSISSGRSPRTACWRRTRPWRSSASGPSSARRGGRRRARGHPAQARLPGEADGCCAGAGWIWRRRGALAAQRAADDTDIKIKRIALEKLRRAVKAAEDAIATLTLRAPAAGHVILGDTGGAAQVPGGRRRFMAPRWARVSSSNATGCAAWLVDVDDGKIAVGMPARVVLDAYPGAPSPARAGDLAGGAPPGEARCRRSGGSSPWWSTR
jgi:hypothetical protein